MMGFVYYGGVATVRIVERQKITAQLAAQRLAVKAGRAAALSVAHRADPVTVRDARQKIILHFPVQEVALKCDL